MLYVASYSRKAGHGPIIYFVFEENGPILGVGRPTGSAVGPISLGSVKACDASICISYLVYLANMRMYGRSWYMFVYRLVVDLLPARRRCRLATTGSPRNLVGSPHRDLVGPLSARECSLLNQ